MGVPNDVYKENENSGLAPAGAGCYKSRAQGKRDTSWGLGEGQIDGKASSHVGYAC